MSDNFRFTVKNLPIGIKGQNLILKGYSITLDKPAESRYCAFAV
jgi:hypothetical protein